MNYLTTLPAGQLIHSLDHVDLPPLWRHANPENGASLLTIPEILINIFVHLPLKDLLAIRVVATLWSHVEGDTAYSLFYKCIEVGSKLCCQLFPSLKEDLFSHRALEQVKERSHYKESRVLYTIAFSVHFLVFIDPFQKDTNAIFNIFAKHNEVLSGPLQYALYLLKDDSAIWALEETRSHLEKAADLHYLPAKCRLAEEYGADDSPDMQQRGISLLQEIAEMNTAEAGYQLSFIYWKRTSKGPYSDPEKAFSCLQNSTLAGHTLAPSKLAYSYLLYYNEFHITSGQAWCYEEIAAARGNPHAQYLLVLKMIQERPQRGLERLEEMAEKGDSNSCYKLARFAFNGYLLPRDPLIAKKYFAKLPKNCTHQAYCYLHGVGVERDLDKAEAIYQYLDNMDELNGENYNEWAFCLSLKKAPMRTVAIYYENAARRNNMEAIFLTCENYSLGKGIDQDKAKAKYFFRMLENHDGIFKLFLGMKYYYLSKCFQLGYGVPQNPLRAKEYIAKAAKHGNAHSQFTLCQQYALGIETDQDPLLAQKYFSALQNPSHPEMERHIPARYRMIGECLLNGYGTEVDREKALHYYKLAADFCDQEAIDFLTKLG